MLIDKLQKICNFPADFSDLKFFHVAKAKELKHQKPSSETYRLMNNRGPIKEILLVTTDNHIGLEDAPILAYGIKILSDGSPVAENAAFYDDKFWAAEYIRIDDVLNILEDDDIWPIYNMLDVAMMNPDESERNELKIICSCAIVHNLTLEKRNQEKYFILYRN